MPTSSDRVFHTPELFEEILLQLFDISCYYVCDAYVEPLYERAHTFLRDFECGKKYCEHPNHREYNESVGQAELMRARRVCKLWDQVIMQSPRIQREASRRLTPKPDVWRNGPASQVQVHYVTAGLFPELVYDCDEDSFEPKGGQQLQFIIRLSQIAAFTTAAKGKRTSLHTILICDPPVTVLDMYMDGLCDYGPIFRNCTPDPEYGDDGEVFRHGSRLCTVVRRSGLTIGDMLEAAEEQLKPTSGPVVLRAVSMDHLEERQILPNTFDLDKLPKLKIPTACQQVFQTQELFEEIFGWLFKMSNIPILDEYCHEFFDEITFVSRLPCDDDKCDFAHHWMYPECNAQAEMMQARKVCRHWNTAIMHSRRLQRAMTRALKIEPEIWRNVWQNESCRFSSHPVKVHEITHGVFDADGDGDEKLLVAGTIKGGQQLQVSINGETIRRFNRIAGGRHTSLHTILLSRPPPTIFDVLIETADSSYSWTKDLMFDADGCSPHVGSRLCTVTKSTGFTMGDLLNVAAQQMNKTFKISSVVILSQDHLEEDREVAGTIVLDGVS